LNVYRTAISRTAIVAALVLVSKAFAGLKEVLIAYRLGTGETLDLFLVACILPVAFVNMVSGCLGASFIPQFQQAKLGGTRQAHHLYSSVLITSVGFTVSICVSLVLVSRFAVSLTSGGLSEGKREAIVQCLALLSPLIPLSGVSMLWSAILNAERRFAVTQLTPMLTTAGTIGVVCLLRPEAVAARLLALAMTSGALAEIAVVGCALRRHGFPLLPVIGPWHPKTGTVIREFAFLSLGTGVMVGVGLINQSYAATLGNGSIALLNYGSKLGLMVISVTSLAIGTVFLPEFSAAAARFDWIALKRTYLRCAGWSVLLLTLVTTILIVLSEPIVRICFQRGAFNATATDTVSRIQIYYFLQVPWVVGGTIGTRVLMALEASRRVLAIGVANLAVAALVTGYFVRHFGVLGIGMSTLSMYALASVATLYLAWRGIGARIRRDGPRQCVAEHELLRA